MTISLKWLGEEQHSLTAYLAYYNDDGQMTALTQLTAAQTADGVDFTGPVTQDVAKLLLLDEALQPVLEAYTSE